MEYYTWLLSIFLKTVNIDDIIESRTLFYFIPFLIRIDVQKVFVFEKKLKHFQLGFLLTVSANKFIEGWFCLALWTWTILGCRTVALWKNFC